MLPSLSFGLHFLLPYHNIPLPVCILQAQATVLSFCTQGHLVAANQGIYCLHSKKKKKTQPENKIQHYMDCVHSLKSEPLVNKSRLCCINQWGTRTALASNLLSNPTALAPLSLPVQLAPNDLLVFCLMKRNQSGCLWVLKEQNMVLTFLIKVYHTQ